MSSFFDVPGLTHVTSHVIDMGDNPSIKQKYCMYDKQKTQIIEWKVRKMLKEGIIKRINSPSCSLLVFCKKHNGKPEDSPEAWRLATIYRILNKQTIFHNYPMTRIEDLLHEGKSRKTMPTLDLKSGYYQIPIRD